MCFSLLWLVPLGSSTVRGCLTLKTLNPKPAGTVKIQHWNTMLSRIPDFARFVLHHRFCCVPLGESCLCLQRYLWLLNPILTLLKWQILVLKMSWPRQGLPEHKPTSNRHCWELLLLQVTQVLDSTGDTWKGSFLLSNIRHPGWLLGFIWSQGRLLLIPYQCSAFDWNLSLSFSLHPPSPCRT